MKASKPKKKGGNGDGEPLAKVSLIPDAEGGVREEKERSRKSKSGRSRGSTAVEAADAFKTEVSSAIALIPEARSIFQLGRLSLAVAKLHACVVMDAEDSTPLGVCMTMTPTEETEGEAEFLSVPELKKRLEWVAVASEETKSAAGAGLGLWKAAAAGVAGAASPTPPPPTGTGPGPRATMKGKCETCGRGGGRASLKAALSLKAQLTAQNKSKDPNRARNLQQNTAAVAQLQSQLDDALRQLHSGDRGPSSIESEDHAEVQRLKALLAQASAAGQALVEKNNELLREKEFLLSENDALKNEMEELQTAQEFFQEEIGDLRRRTEVAPRATTRFGGTSTIDPDSDDPEEDLLAENADLICQLQTVKMQNKALERQLSAIGGGGGAAAMIARGLELPTDQGVVGDYDRRGSVFGESDDEDASKIKAQLSSTGKQLNLLKKEYDEVAEENAALNKKFEDMEAKMEEFNKNGLAELELLRIENSDLKVQVADLSEALNEEKEDTSVLRLKTGMAEGKMKRMKQEQERQMADLGNLVSKDSQSGSGVRFGAVLSEDSVNSTEASDIQAIIGEAVLKMEVENPAPPEVVERLKRELSVLPTGLVRALATCSRDLTSLRVSSRQLTREKERAFTQLTEMSAEKEKLATKVSELEEDLLQQQDKVQGLEMEMAMRTRVRTETVAPPPETPEDVILRCEALEMELSQQGDAYILALQERDKERAAHKAAKEELKEAVERATKELQGTVDRLTKELQDCDAKRKEVEKEQDQLSKAAKKLKDEVAELQERLAAEEERPKSCCASLFGGGGKKPAKK